MTEQSRSASAKDDPADFHVERYKFILQQIATTNENVYRFLAIYQTLATALASAVLLLFVSFKKWGLAVESAEMGMVGLMLLLTVVAAFTVLLIIVGLLSWYDYRKEECELTDQVVGKGFRAQPRLRNIYRWYEPYVVLFIAGSVTVMWLLLHIRLLPALASQS